MIILFHYSVSITMLIMTKILCLYVSESLMQIIRRNIITFQVLHLHMQYYRLKIANMHVSNNILYPNDCTVSLGNHFSGVICKMNQNLSTIIVLFIIPKRCIYSDCLSIHFMCFCVQNLNTQFVKKKMFETLSVIGNWEMKQCISCHNLFDKNCAIVLW